MRTWGAPLRRPRPLEPDFLLLQEVDVDGTRSHHVDEKAYIQSLLPGFGPAVFAQNYDSPYLFWPLLEPHGANRAGQLTMSRYPIASALRRSLPIEEGVMKLVDLDRCYSVSRIPVDGGGELVLYNLHLSAYTSDGKIAEEQLKMLFADMLAEYEAGNWAVAGGDFNKDLLGNSDEIFGVSGPDYTWAQAIPPELIPEGWLSWPPLTARPLWPPAATPTALRTGQLPGDGGRLHRLRQRGRGAAGSRTPASAGATTTRYIWISP